MNKIRLFFATLLLAVCTLSCVAFADIDRITNYVITVEPQSDGTLDMTYSIEWKVLSSLEGPLTWVEIGLPNNHVSDWTALSDTIDRMTVTKTGETLIKIYFKGKYGKDETVNFSFKIHQDYMYDMNNPVDGKTKYTFTPGWFNDIKVEKLTIRWKNDNAESWSPSCLNDGGYLVWETSLNKGGKYTVDVTYPTDAMNFSADKYYINKDVINYDGYSSYSDEDDGTEAVVFAVLFIFGVAIFLIASSGSTYSSSANMGETKTKYTRTIIKYYAACPNCGAAREPDAKECKFCGRSLVESETVIKDEMLKNEYKAAGSYKTSGTYRYSQLPNSDIRVVVTRVPVSNSHHHHHGGGGCVHSSCACAHSCACACACACAGGGRAGCTEKDFYNTGLKLKSLELKKKGNK